MKAMIFAAGLGTRLKPITDSIPKALVEVSGRTLLEIQIKKLVDAGFNDIVVNVHHFAQQIRDYLKENDNFGANVLISDETDLLRDTGGGVKHASVLLNDNEPVLIHNVDILSNVDLDNLYQHHINSSISDDTPLATLLVSERKTSRYFLFDNDMNLVGWMNQISGEVRSPFKELVHIAKNYTATTLDSEKFLLETGLSKRAFAGMHVISPYVFRLMQSWPDRFPIVDFYLDNCDKYNIRAYCKEDLKLVDVGKLDSLNLAEDFFKKSCPRCGKLFTCRHDDISNCHCSSISLSSSQLEYISSHYTDCLCHECLEAIKAEI